MFSPRCECAVRCLSVLGCVRCSGRLRSCGLLSLRFASVPFCRPWKFKAASAEWFPSGTISSPSTAIPFLTMSIQTRGSRSFHYKRTHPKRGGDLAGARGAGALRLQQHQQLRERDFCGSLSSFPWRCSVCLPVVSPDLLLRCFPCPGSEDNAQCCSLAPSSTRTHVLGLRIATPIRCHEVFYQERQPRP